MTDSSSSASPPTCAAVMSFDAAGFVHAQKCIETLRAQCRSKVDLCILAIELPEDQIAWLKSQDAKIQTETRGLPHWAGAPKYSTALTCRAFLPEIFPAYDVYFWIDADIRFLYPDAFGYYLGRAREFPRAIAIAQELDSAYNFIHEAAVAEGYQMQKHQRITRAHGSEAADLLRYHISYNSGLWAMHRTCPIWAEYRRSVQRATDAKFSPKAEQDALNLAIVQGNHDVSVAPSIMNWLCSAALPARLEPEKRWVRPTFPHLPIAVAHLTDSSQRIVVQGQQMTYWELYKQYQLT